MVTSQTRDVTILFVSKWKTGLKIPISADSESRPGLLCTNSANRNWTYEFTTDFITIIKQMDILFMTQQIQVACR